MKEIETNIKMDTTKCRARSCDASNITNQESQWNLQMFTPIMKQETVQHLYEEEIPQCMDEEKIPQCMNEEESFCNHYMSPCKPLLTSDCVDNSDCKFYMFEKVKKEFPEDEYPQPDYSRTSRTVFENADISQVIERQEFKEENSEGSLSLIKNEEIDDEQYPVIVKVESLEEHRVLDNFGDYGIHYDVLVAPQQVQCKLCDRTFKNRFTLLKHNNEHIKIVMYPTKVDIEMNELHKCKSCHEHFNSHGNMLAHVRDVHSNKRHKSEFYHESIKPYITRKNGEEIEYKCDSCERFYKSKTALELHKKKNHVDNEGMFECWCGKQFRTPRLLSEHKYEYHWDPLLNKRNNKFQCDSCNKICKLKSNLIRHINIVHYDNDKTFKCSCGKQFRSPISLSLHKKRQHGPKFKIVNNKQLQCDSCHKSFKTKHNLVYHINVNHYDYGKTFECSCGKQFRTPIHLSLHKRRQHCADVKNIDNERFQCHICQKLLKTKECLTTHIKDMHYDYGKIFECSCGKQFRTPRYLREHKYRMHGTTGRTVTNSNMSLAGNISKTNDIK